MILEGADGGVRDHYTRYKVAQSGGTWFLSTLCIIFWGSVISNLTIQGLQNSKKVDDSVKIELDLENSTWKNPQKISGHQIRTMNSISVKKLSKTLDGARS